MTDHTANQGNQIGQVADSFVARFRAGERPSIEEYARKYPELADELRQLLPALVMLEQHGSLDGDGGLAGQAAALQPAPREIGEFTIVREIGRGGMGVVYEAVQQSLGRHVALKVLSSPGLLNPTHLERFRLEARSAGRLHHSHIVPVFGVGESDGLHYYAMQFIAGQSLDQVIHALRRVRPGHGADKTSPPATNELSESIVGGLLSGRFARESPADQNGAGAVESLAKSSDETPRAAGENSATPELATTGQFSSGSSGRPFYESVARVGLQVAEALAYAHTEGILHRDIKPSNLLLDAKGNTWVTDFGLVKAEDTQSLTETGDFVGTLRYMAPERLEGWSDRRSDIYSLGVTLYELQTLHTFFENANRGQLIDHIRQKQPEAPTKIDPSIPRDLETIVLKALAKEPGSRYHTADAMADDLRRFLADRPILARRSTTTERFVRWCRRNPLVASLTATVLVALVGGTAISSYFAIESAARRRQAEANLVEARRQQQRADAGFREAQAAVDKYYTAVSESTLFNVPGLQPLRKQLLESALAYYQKFIGEYGHDPQVRSAMAKAHSKVADINEDIGSIEASLTPRRKAVEIYEQLVKEDPSDAVKESQLAAGQSNLGNSQRNVGQTTEAEASYQKAIATWERLVKGYPSVEPFRRDMAVTYLNRGLAQQKAGRLSEAEVSHQKTMAIFERLVKENPLVAQYQHDLACGYNSHGFLQRAAGQSKESEASYQKAIAIWERLVNESPSVAQYQHDPPSDRHGHEIPQRAAAQSKEEEDARRKAVEIQKRLESWNPPSPAEYQSNLANSHNNLGALQATAGRRIEAETSFQKAIAIWERLVGENPSIPAYQLHLARSHDSLGLLQNDAGRTAEAEACYQKAIEIWGRLVKENASIPAYQDALASSYNRVALLQLDTGRRAEAEASYLKAIEISEQLLKATPSVTKYESILANSHNSVGSLQNLAGRRAEAEASYQRAIEISERLVQGDPSNTEYQVGLARGHYNLGLLQHATGRRSEAEASYQKVVEVLQRIVKEIPSATECQLHLARAHNSLALLQLDTGRRAEAEGSYQKAIESWETLVKNSPSVTEYQNGLAWLLATTPFDSQRDVQQARSLAQAAVSSHPGQPSYLSTLGVAQYREGNWEEAIESLHKSAELYGRGTPDNVDNYLFLAMAHWKIGNKDEARTWYNRSVEWMEKNQPKNEELIRFRAEAEQLLGITQPSPAPKPSTAGKNPQQVEDTAKPKC